MNNLMVSDIILKENIHILLGLLAKAKKIACHLRLYEYILLRLYEYILNLGEKKVSRVAQISRGYERCQSNAGEICLESTPNPPVFLKGGVYM